MQESIKAKSSQWRTPWSSEIQLVKKLSINLAVLNSLPLPLLDGGQLVFTLIEGFRGKPVPVKVQMAVTQSSFFLLVGLSVLLIIRDTSQLLIVQRLLNQ